MYVIADSDNHKFTVFVHLSHFIRIEKVQKMSLFYWSAWFAIETFTRDLTAEM